METKDAGVRIEMDDLVVKQGLLKTPDMRLDGQVAVVTGAGRGIGSACAMAMAEAGACTLAFGAQLHWTRATHVKSSSARFHRRRFISQASSSSTM